MSCWWEEGGGEGRGGGRVSLSQGGCSPALHYHPEPTKMREKRKLFTLFKNKLLTLQREKRGRRGCNLYETAFDAPQLLFKNGRPTG